LAKDGGEDGATLGLRHRPDVENVLVPTTTRKIQSIVDMVIWNERAAVNVAPEYFADLGIEFRHWLVRRGEKEKGEAEGEVCQHLLKAGPHGRSRSPPPRLYMREV
jgi:hypothetical protein